MYQYQFTLKQHTPMIHFQSEQEGATIRSSDVKPRLDRFLIQKLGLVDEENKVKDEYKYLFHDQEHFALDYKIDFEAVGLRITQIERNHRNSPNYFGNMGESDIKHFSFADNIEGKILTSHKYLTEEINKVLDIFFLENNFGTRQSKGYGSFTILKDNKINTDFNYFSYFNYSDLEDCMRKIEIFYKSLRSGYNLKNRNQQTILYFKPMIYHYLNSKNLQWDKRTIKDQLFSNNIHITNNNQQMFLYKELLGLSVLEKWKKNVEKKHVNNQIDRFKSPLFFKPVNNKVYILFHPFLINNEMFEQEFQVSGNSRSFMIKTSNNSNFNYDEFLQYAINQFYTINIDCSPTDNRANGIKNDLERIYSELNQNLKSNEN